MDIISYSYVLPHYHIGDYESHVLGEVEEKGSESGGKGRCILNEINKVIFIEQF